MQGARAAALAASHGQVKEEAPSSLSPRRGPSSLSLHRAPSSPSPRRGPSSVSPHRGPSSPSPSRGPSELS
eukprot:9634155-Lingulodinium_polyedra.AAC.1